MDSMPNSRSARMRRSKRSDVSTRPSRTGTAARLRMWSCFGSSPVVSRSRLIHSPGGAGRSRPAHQPLPNCRFTPHSGNAAILVVKVEALADVVAKVLDHVQRVPHHFRVRPAPAHGPVGVFGRAAPA